MNRRSFLQNVGLVTVTAGVASATTYLLARPTVRPPRGIYVQMGTSITAGLHGPGANLTPTTVGSRLNLMPINVGFDGAYVGTLHDPIMDEFSLCRLVDAILSGDWSAQDKAVVAFDPVNVSILSRFKAIDFSKVTHLALEYGANDFTHDMPIGTNADTTNETFKGSLNYAIRKLLASFPQLHLLLIAPAWRLNLEDLDSDTHPNSRGIFLREYVDAMLETAALNHVPCLDMWRTLGLGINNYKSFTYDGTHPNEAGAIRRGEAIAAFMSSVFEMR
jgi:lysophospholipase L1-like esterase